MNAIDQLVGIASAPIFPRPSRLTGLPSSLSQLLAAKNGFFAFENALLVLPSAGNKAIPGIPEWNQSTSWRRHYPKLSSEILFLALDAFSCQFGIDTAGKVYRLDSETAELQDHTPDLSAWAEKILAADLETGWSVAKEWQEHWGPLEPGERLLGKKPFILGGDYVLENLVAVPCRPAMEKLGGLASQIADVEDGTTVTVKGWL